MAQGSVIQVPLKIFLKLACIPITLLYVGRQTSLDDRFQTWGDERVNCTRRRRRLLSFEAHLIDNLVKLAHR